MGGIQKRIVWRIVISDSYSNLFPQLSMGVVITIVHRWMEKLI
ncbi:hypothetical protein J2T58_001400 [Methanocalculus alkaliphilus]|nr:hypothetical protein [Methanocalculus alkaliphilus]